MDWLSADRTARATEAAAKTASAANIQIAWIVGISIVVAAVIIAVVIAIRKRKA